MKPALHSSYRLLVVFPFLETSSAAPRPSLLQVLGGIAVSTLHTSPDIDHALEKIVLPHHRIISNVTAATLD